MKKSSIIYKFFILFIVLIGCKKEEKYNDEFITKNSIIEFRSNIRPDFGKLELIDNSNEKFEPLRKYFNKLEGFTKTDKEVNIYPYYILSSKKFKILIDLDIIYIEYYDYRNNNIKLYKNITTNELSQFFFLSRNNNWIYDLGKVYGEGNFHNGKYTFCGLTAKEENYKYKVGKWKFWNLNRELIAEGEFVTDSSIVKGQGGCDYYIRTSKIKKEKWKFYDSEHKLINPSFEDIYTLENAKTIYCVE